jgi:hypothetical protein
MSFPDQQPPRPGRRPDPHVDYAHRHDDLPEHHRVAGPRSVANALWQFNAGVGNLLADANDTLGHFFSQLGNLIGSLLEAHGDLD